MLRKCEMTLRLSCARFLVGSARYPKISARKWMRSSIHWRRCSKDGLVSESSPHRKARRTQRETR